MSVFHIMPHKQVPAIVDPATVEDDEPLYIGTLGYKAAPVAVAVLHRYAYQRTADGAYLTISAGFPYGRIILRRWFCSTMRWAHWLAVCNLSGVEAVGSTRDEAARNLDASLAQYRSKQ